jgi:hypothetical protein
VPRLPVLRVPSRDAVPLLGLLALLLVLFSPLVFSGRVIYTRDIHLYWTAQAETLVRTIARGSPPVWNPHISFGQPLLGDPNNQILYPLTWLHLILPPWVTYTLFVLAHFVLTGTGMYLAARQLGLTRAGAFSSAALWILSGPLMSLVDVWNHLAGTAWLPWVFFFANRALRERRARDVFLWAATLAMPVFGGSAESAVMAAIASCLQVVLYLDWRAPGSPANRRLVLTALTGVGLALILSAAQWLPTLDMVGRSARRELGEQVRTHWSVPPGGLLQIALPIFPKDLPLRSESPFDEMQFPFLYSLYLGLPTLGLIPLAFRGAHRRTARLLGPLALALVLLATGRHAVFYPVAVAAIPVLKIFRYPVKATLLAAFCAALLAGMGLEVWRSAGDSRFSFRFRAYLALLAGLAGFAFWAARERAEAWGPLLLSRPANGPSFGEILSPTAHAFGRAALVALGVLALALLRDRGPGARAWSGGAVVGLAVLELLAAHRGLNRTGPREIFLYKPPTVDLVRPRQGERFYFRERRTPLPEDRNGPDWLGRHAAAGLPIPVAVALSLRMYLTTPIGGTWGLYSSFEPNINGIQPAPVAALTSLLRSVEGTPLHLRLLQLAAVKHVIALDTPGLEGLPLTTTLANPFGDPVYVFEVPDPLPRAYVVGRARVANPPGVPAALIAPDFDPHREVILPDAAGGGDGASFSGQVRLLELRPDAVRVEADLSAPGYVVLVEAFDPGWRAAVDGTRAEVRPANGAFQAVPVPAGKHDVRFVYRPSPVGIGLALSALGWLGGVVMAMRPRASAAPSPVLR